MGEEPDRPVETLGTERSVTTIRANCPDCGDVQLTAADVTLRVCTDDERSTYTFRCPLCGDRVVKNAGRRVVDLLVAGGVRLDLWRLPAELWEPRRAGPPIVEDDVDAFRLLLDSDDWFDRLATEVGRPEER